MDALSLLRSAGWHAGRDVDVTSDVAALADEDFEITESAVLFLREFAGLRIAGPGNPNPLEIGGPDLALDADSGWCELYAEAIGSKLVPVGEYSNMVLFIDEAGGLWGGFDNEYGRGDRRWSRSSTGCSSINLGGVSTGGSVSADHVRLILGG